MNSFHNSLKTSGRTQTACSQKVMMFGERDYRLRFISIDQIGYFLITLVPLVSMVNILPVTKIAELFIRPLDCLFLIVSAIFFMHVVKRIRLGKKFSIYLCLLLGLVTMTLTGLLICPNYSVIWPKYFRFIETIMWGGYALIFIKSRKQLDTVMNSVVLAGVCMALISISLYLYNPTLHRIAGHVVFAGSEGATEGQSGFNEWGALFALIVGITLWRIYYGGLSIWKVLVLIIVIAGLMLVQSRSSFLAVICTLCILFWPDIKRICTGQIRKQALAMLVFLIVAGIAVILFSGYLTLNRLSESFDPSSSAYQSIILRLDIWPSGIELASKNLANFLFGYGSQSVVYLLDQAVTTDNFFLDHALGEGFLGVLFILALILMPVASVYKNRLLVPERKMVLVGTAVALVVSLTGNVLVDPTYGSITFIVLYGHLYGTS